MNTYTVADAEQAHVLFNHTKNGFSEDWMECPTSRCMEARLLFGLDLRHCPTCGGDLARLGKWIHAGAEPKVLQTVLGTMLPTFVEQVRQAVLAELAKEVT